MMLWHAAIGVFFLVVGVWGWWAAPRLVNKNLEGEERREREMELRRSALGYLLMAAIGIWFVIELGTQLNE